jgi:hypothetical protein
MRKSNICVPLWNMQSRISQIDLLVMGVAMTHVPDADARQEWKTVEGVAAMSQQTVTGLQSFTA